MKYLYIHRPIAAFLLTRSGLRFNLFCLPQLWSGPLEMPGCVSNLFIVQCSEELKLPDIVCVQMVKPSQCVGRSNVRSGVVQTWKTTEKAPFQNGPIVVAQFILRFYDVFTLLPNSREMWSWCRVFCTHIDLYIFHLCDTTIGYSFVFFI